MRLKECVINPLFVPSFNEETNRAQWISFLSRLTIIEDDCRECIASLNYKDDKNDVTHAEAHRM